MPSHAHTVHTTNIAAWSWWARRSGGYTTQPTVTPTAPLPFKPPSPFEEHGIDGAHDQATPRTPATSALQHVQEDSTATSAGSPSGSSASSEQDAWKDPEVVAQPLLRTALPAVAGEMVSNRDLREFVSAGASAGLAVRVGGFCHWGGGTCVVVVGCSSSHVCVCSTSYSCTIPRLVLMFFCVFWAGAA